MSKKGGGAVLQKEVPWRASNGPKPIPKIHHSPLLRIPQTPFSDYAISVMKHPNPIGNGLGQEAIVESAGPDCIVPGQTTPIKLLGLKVALGKWRWEKNLAEDGLELLLYLLAEALNFVDFQHLGNSRVEHDLDHHLLNGGNTLLAA